ncbi:hypothetical protein [Alicyclobacillus sp. ALC3]|uniref:hypothetical protein n=1 Tax=Alicyclobacillus sp. ALC3 TaxID=2796143 RepID=UPI002379E1A7|nr:hypothetical protein [Alicyclobacillus sp. ALC3]WDL97821.1 hypothetical protein JC200_03560 [Alicyclobacillus sp. ALC3]
MMHIWPYLYAIQESLDDVMPAIRAAQELENCPPFRKCKSRKWQRRRNKQFYRILDGLKPGGDAA